MSISSDIGTKFILIRATVEQEDDEFIQKLHDKVTELKKDRDLAELYIPPNHPLQFISWTEKSVITNAFVQNSLLKQT